MKTFIFMTLLQITFIVLKLCEVIAWNWLAVCLPVMIYLGIQIIEFIFVLVVGIIGSYKGWGI